MIEYMSEQVAREQSARCEGLGYMTAPKRIGAGWGVSFTGYGTARTVAAVDTTIAAGRVPRLAAEYEARLAASRAVKAAAI